MKSEGIVYKTITYKETSKIVYIYTKDGKKSIKALGSKNSKNKTFGFGEIGNIVSFVSTDDDFPTLIEYDILNSAYKYVDSFDSIFSLSKIIELINYLPDDSIHYKLYPFIKDIILNLLNNPLKLLSIFLIKMTYNFGVSPKLDSCINCGNNNVSFFSLKRGSAMCDNCIEGYKDDLKIWTEYYKDKKNYNEYSECNYKDLLKRINEYYLIHAHINLKL